MLRALEHRPVQVVVRHQDRQQHAYAPLAKGVRQRTYAIPSADAIQVDVDNDVIIARWQNRVHAFSTKCPHKGAKLRWLEDEEKIFCPKHKARFGRDGDALTRQYFVSVDAVDAILAELGAAGVGHEPVDRDDLYSKYEAASPDWFQLDH